jgi:DNA-binding response OmpR family regulator
MNIDELVVIMVVEDDQLIQGLVSDALSEGGFEAAVAQSGEEAITLLQDQRTHYRALIADINLCGSQDGGKKRPRVKSRHSRDLHDGGGC